MGDIDLALYLEAGTTAGTGKSSARTIRPAWIACWARRPPGRRGPQHATDDLNARLSLKGARWQFQVGYQGFLNVGTGVGTTLTLDPDGDFSVELINADFTYHLFDNDVWTVEAQLGYLGTTTRADLTPTRPAPSPVFSPPGFRTGFSFASTRNAPV